jgi:16S rRNA (guanine527-N7)-methyltransferase
MDNHNSGREWFAAQYDVSRETLDRLEIYAEELTKWNDKINLVSRSTVQDVWQRHFADSAQLSSIVAGHSGLWADFGSGAGFPGLVIAAMDPDRPVVLVESDQRKAAFLASTAHKMGLRPRIESQRIESLDPLCAQVISARALAPLAKLLEFAAIHRADGSICVFPKGAQVESELTAARLNWHIEVEQVQSLTDPAATILKIREFSRVDA